MISLVLQEEVVWSTTSDIYELWPHFWNVSATTEV